MMIRGVRSDAILLLLLFLGLTILIINLSSIFPSNKATNSGEITHLSIPLKGSIYNSQRRSPGSQAYKNINYPQNLLEDYQTYVLFSTRKSILQKNDDKSSYRFHSIDWQKGVNYSLWKEDICRSDNLLQLFDIAQSDHIDLSTLYPAVYDGKPNEAIFTFTVDPIENERPFSSPKGEILLVLASYNQLSKTVLSLQFLRNTYRIADIVVIDDHSTDGTTEYLRKRGVAIISKNETKGIIDSWNIGYRLASTLGYKYIIFSDGNALITIGSILLMQIGLSFHPLVVPLTSVPHSDQSFSQVNALAENMNSLVYDYRNADLIQEALLNLYVKVPQEQRRCPARKALNEQGFPQFDTFFFGVNLEKIKPAAFEPDIYLFDPLDEIRSESLNLMKRMHSKELYASVLHCIFVYRLNSSQSISRFDFKPSEGTLVNIEDPINASEHQQPLCPAKATDVLFPRPQRSNQSKLLSLYSNYHKLSWAVHSSPPCVYPTLWSKHCSALLHEEDYFPSDFLASKFSEKIVIAFAISDPVSSPSAGDIFTAYELGGALESMYPGVKVRYLHRGKTWYSPEHLFDVDILIAMLDQYDLRKVHLLLVDASMFKTSNESVINCRKTLQIKPNLISIAWVRNWFHRWLSRPWFGNFDVILTSSKTSKSFYDAIMSTIGLPSSCSTGCPWKPSDRVPLSLPQKYDSGALSHRISELSQTNNHASNGKWFFQNSRVESKIIVYPLATSLRHVRNDVINFTSRFDTEALRTSSSDKEKPSEASAKAVELFSGVDYIFTGSYFNVPRRIMSFDPALLPAWKGRIVGKDWNRANVSEAWKRDCVGFQPYEVVKQAYKHVKIVIDDANHATYPWGSVNSRVFDALASGALVLSNGGVGFEEVFGQAFSRRHLQLPLYSTGEDLASKLQFYLSNDILRTKLVLFMQQIVLKEHSYSRRASQLESVVRSTFGLNLYKSIALSEIHTNSNTPKSRRNLMTSPDNTTTRINGKSSIIISSSSRDRGEGIGGYKGTARTLKRKEETPKATKVPAPKLTPKPQNPAPSKENLLSGKGSSSVCVGVRTTKLHDDWLPLIVKSLIVQQSRSKYRDRLALSVFVADLESNTDYVKHLIDIASRYNRGLSTPAMHVMVPFETSPSSTDNLFHGHDFTDILLDHMLSLNRCDNPTNVSVVKSHSCDWILFTNDTYMYNSAWFDAIAPFAVSDKYDMIGWDYISNGTFDPSRNMQNGLVNITFERGFVDLASVLVRSETYIKSGAKFLQESVLTQDLHDRDWLALQRMHKITPPERIRLIHQVLLLQQKIFLL